MVRSFALSLPLVAALSLPWCNEAENKIHVVSASFGLNMASTYQ
jgi:hypothetical protein